LLTISIQQSLLPNDPLSLAGVRFAGRCIPAAAVGGDYFGYFADGESGVDSLIGDVSRAPRRSVVGVSGLEEAIVSNRHLE
jgi:serine phosphatase RsbU (regulator of sigma subunit)